MSDVAQDIEGIHKFDDPVSNITLNFWGGVPMLISP